MPPSRSAVQTASLEARGCSAEGQAHGTLSINRDPSDLSVVK